MSKENIHEGHRERMWSKYINGGIDIFAEHEMLEMLLYRIYPRCNTNDISHRLLEHFASLDGVIEATPHELMQVEGVGKKAAREIAFIGDFIRYLRAKTPKRIVLNSVKNAAKYCRSIMDFRLKECAYVLFLDKHYELICQYRVSQTALNSAKFQLRDIAARAVRCDSAGVILTHTHHSSPIIPSTADIVTTRMLANYLRAMNIHLEDHLILTPDSEYSLRSSELLADIWG